MNSEDVKIKKVIYSNPWTHIIWEDGSKTSSKCDEADTYDELTGFMMCVFKKKIPAKEMRKMFNDYVYGNDKKYIKRDKKKIKKNYDNIVNYDRLKEAIRESAKYKFFNDNPRWYVTPNVYPSPHNYVFTLSDVLPAGTYTITFGHGGI